MQSKEELEAHYSSADPWGVKVNSEDIKRRRLLVYIAEMFAPCMDNLACYPAALDVACGEGWITQYLPAYKISGLEISDNAAGRFHASVERVKEITTTYDLVTCFGALYNHYQAEHIVAQIRRAAMPGGIVMVSYITDWENLDTIAQLSSGWTNLFTAQFPYIVPGPGHTQTVRVWRVPQ